MAGLLGAALQGPSFPICSGGQDTLHRSGVHDSPARRSFGLSPMKKLLLATSNRKKIEEFRAMFEDLGMEVLSLADFPGLALPPEDGKTFAENALLKARHAAAAAGIPALADDSGLAADALGGAPGVFSARYAGEGATDEENVQKLLDEMRDVKEEARTARFVCVLAYVEPGGIEKTFTGTLEGRIAERPAGRGGFGYDPVFFIPEKGAAAAELSMEEKNAISHRGRALRKFRDWLASRAGKRAGAAHTQ